MIYTNKVILNFIGSKLFKKTKYISLQIKTTKQIFKKLKCCVNGYLYGYSK